MPSLLVVFWVLLLAVFGYAQLCGGRPEKVVAMLLLAAALLTIVYRTHASTRYSLIDPGVVAIDTGLLVALVVVALTVDRGWPTVIAALQAITLLGHVGKLVNPELWRLGYAILITAPAYPGLAVLALGTFRYRQRAHASAVQGF